MTWLSNQVECLARFRRGENKALAEVYEHYAPDLARSLALGFSFQSQGNRFHFSGLRSAFDLDDVLQETFLRAFSEKSRQAYDEARPFAAWLEAIAHNLVVDRYRLTSRFCPLDGQGPESLSPHPSERLELSPEDEAIQKELKAMYRGFMAELSKNDRLLVELRFEHQASRREVSEQTGYSAMKVRIREKQLREQLMALLRQQGWDRVFGPPKEAQGALL